MLTDFLVRSFGRTVIAELGLDRYPELRDDYFAHYTRMVWLAQEPDDELAPRPGRLPTDRAAAHRRAHRTRRLAGWHPFVECPVQRTAAYVGFRDAVAQRDGARAESLLRGLHGVA